MENHFDYGIVGFWYGINYGSVLTYYALYQLITERGYSAILVNKPTFLWEDRFYRRDSLSNQFFIRHNVKRSRIRYSDDDWRDMNNFCDAFVVGSDVVWKSNVTKRTQYYFMLNWVADNKKKISFATSFGGEWEGVNEEVTCTSRYYLNKFDYISCREIEGVNILKSTFGIEGEHILDPVFVLDPSVFIALAGDSERKLPDKYICSYILGPGANKRKMLLTLQKNRGGELINIVNAGNEQIGKERLNLETVSNLSIEDWLYEVYTPSQTMMHSDLYIGDSFHGICFSIIFRKDFILIRNRVSPSRCRFDTLLKICGLEHRSIYGDEDISQRMDLLEPIDYEAVYRRLKPYILRSELYLERALSGKKENMFSDYDVIVQMINKMKLENENLKQQIQDLKQLMENK